MKNLKLFTLAIAICISTLSFATTTNENPNNELRQQIVKLLGKTSLTLADSHIKTEVVFTVNDKSEIVIISVKTKNSSIESFVKNRLNHKKVKLETTSKEKIFYLPLTLSSNK
jgi:cytochrome c556